MTTTRPAPDDDDADAPAGAHDGAFMVDVDGYAGPLDVLLTLAREQKVDLRCISIVALVDQYLAFIADARRANLHLAAEYLVMAAWLTYLKSRLLLPEPHRAGPEEEEMADALARRLQQLDAIRGGAQWLSARRRLGQDFFARGGPEALQPAAIKSVAALDLYDLLKSYADVQKRRNPAVLRIEPPQLTSVDAALRLLRRVLGNLTGWRSLWSLLPPGTIDGVGQGRLPSRSSVAAMFVASLELTREGAARVRQSSPFAAVEICPANEPGVPR